VGFVLDFGPSSPFDQGTIIWRLGPSCFSRGKEARVF
jgi:hypothetical protein